MSNLAVRLVHAWPMLGNLAATVRGWQLLRERYGPTYQSAVEEFEERQEWSVERIREYQSARLQELISGAARHVPLYRRVFAERGLDADEIREPEDLTKLPPVEKADLRDAGEQLLDERFDRRRLVVSQTSGSTGIPVQVFASREAIQRHYALFEVRCRRVAGMEFGRKPYVMLGAQAVVSPGRCRPPFWCYNYAWKQLYMSTYHLSERNLPAYVAALRKRPYHAILGFPFSLYLLARYALEDSGPPIRFKAAIPSGEVLQGYWRETIERAFDCEVFNQYSCSEQCVFAAECSHGRMHISVDTCVVEVVDEQDQPVPIGESGQLLCTGLLNDAQPLIRYRLGDCGRLSAERCPCGSPFPVLAALEGRSGNALVLPDGRRLSVLATGRLLAGVGGVTEWQIVQQALDRFQLRVVTNVGLSPADMDRLRGNLVGELGDVQVSVERVERIERTRAGKAKLLVSELAGTDR